jgi:hypothetical protein
MQVVSKLVRMDFKVGKIERDGERLVITSDPEASMPARVYLTTDDVKGMIGAALNWSVLSYFVMLPVFCLRNRGRS